MRGGGMYRHRNCGYERILREFALLFEVAPERAGTDGQDDIVDGGLESVLQLLYVIESNCGQRHLAMRGYSRVQRRARRREREGALHVVR